MIGYYVHHVGRGHAQRALAVATALGEPVTGLSSLPPPAGWPGPWVRLDRDDDGDDGDDGDDARAPEDPTAGGRLHWVPCGHAGLRTRMATVAGWLRDASPRVVVVDVSVEVAVLVRLHGVPVVAVAVPGDRGDPAHLLGFDVADAVVGCWPPAAAGMLRGLPRDVLRRVRPVGGLSRFPVALPAARRPGPRRVAVLVGAGGHDLTTDELARARAATPGWEWTVLDRTLGSWSDDPFPLLVDADVVVTHAGQNAVAEVAAARTPAVVVPQARPHREQVITGQALESGGWPAVVVPSWGGPDGAQDWAGLLERAAALDGSRWASWCDGRAADRFADVVRGAALRAGA